MLGIVGASCRETHWLCGRCNHAFVSRLRKPCRGGKMDENMSVGRYTWARITFCRVVLGVTGECGGEVQSGIWLLELAICHCQLIFVRGCANINNSGLWQLWGGRTHEWVHVCVNASSAVPRTASWELPADNASSRQFPEQLPGNCPQIMLRPGSSPNSSLGTARRY